MAKLTLDSRVTGNEAMLLLEALNTFLRTEDPTVAFSNRELTVLLGEAAGGCDYDVLSDFSTKAISEMVVFEEIAKFVHCPDTLLYFRLGQIALIVAVGHHRKAHQGAVGVFRVQSIPLAHGQ